MTLAISALRAVALLAIGAAIAGQIVTSLAFAFGQRGAGDAPAESVSARAR